MTSFTRVAKVATAMGIAGAILAGGAASAQAATTNGIFQGPVVFDGNKNGNFIYTLLQAGPVGTRAYASFNPDMTTKWVVPRANTTGTISQGDICLQRTSDNAQAEIIYATCTGKVLQKFKTVRNASYAYFAIPSLAGYGTGIGLASEYLGKNALQIQTSDIPEGVNYSLFSDVAEQSVAITGPTNGSTVTTKRPTMTGSGEPGATITVTTQTGITLGTTTVKADGTWTLPAQNDIDTTTPTITATQTIPGGPTTTTTVTFTITISATVPTADMTIPTDVSQQATIGGAGENGATITVTVDGKAMDSATVAGGAWSMPVPSSVGAGSHMFVVTQTVGGTAAGSTTVTHDFGPAVSASSRITGSTATVSGTGANGSRIVVTENGTQVGTATVTNGVFSVPVQNVSNGSHTYAVTQTAPGVIVTRASTTANRVSAITVLNPADPSTGYKPNTAFTFSGTAPKTAGTLTIRNFTGLLIATVPVDPTTGAWSWTRTNMGTSTWKLTFTTNAGTANQESYTLPDFAPNAKPALDLQVLNPANPAIGYTPNTAFTFSGVAKKTAGTLTIRNFTGLLIATVPVDPTTGAWSWTRTNMGTSTWKLTFATEEGTPNAQKVTLGDFAPNASQALKFTNPTDPATGYVANTAFTFRGTALPNAKVQLTNFTGVVLANLTADASGNWSWTRANMGTSIWKVTATAGAGTSQEQTVTLGDFAPRP